MLKIRHHSKLWLYFTAVVFATICAVFVLITLTWLALYWLGYIAIDPHEHRVPLLLFALGSLLLGTVIAVYAGKRILRPVQQIGDAFDALSRGDFSVKVSEKQQLEEIREIAQRFNAMVYELSHIETLRSDFVADVSHEFKTPIAAIEGYATLLQNPKLSPEKHAHYVQKILDNARSLGTMSGNILLLSKLENQQIVPEQEEFRLDEQLRQCVLTLESKWTPKQLEFDIELPRQMYFGSRALLEQVWRNLLDNAIKHSPVGGCIHIELCTCGTDVEVCIRDHGDGMTQEVQKHIFEKFYQADRSRTGEGNGLGLALVKRIVQLCHGDVDVRSAPGQGAAFRVRLPDRENRRPL